MREIKLLLFTLLFYLLIGGNVWNQNSIQVSSKIGSQVQYSTTTLAANTHLFILYGDGEFGIQHNPTHIFPPSDNGYLTEAYFVKAYDTNPPPKLTVNTGSIVGGGTATNPTINMNGEIDILTSWAPAEDLEHYFILSFSNRDGLDTLDGCLEFHYRNDQVEINYAGIKKYNQWVVNQTNSGSTKWGYDEMLHWNFTQLAPGEIRHVYIPVRVTAKSGEFLELAANYIADCLPVGEDELKPSRHIEASFRTRTHPHDPNSKTVNRPCINPLTLEKQQLEYTITFFNDGNGFAHDVFIDDILSPLLDPTTVQILDYEYPPTVTVSGQHLSIDFIGMKLPGTNQTYPLAYSYEDASSFVKFSICTASPIAHPNFISNTADIQFDNQQIFVTAPSTIFTDELCEIHNPCQISSPSPRSSRQSTANERTDLLNVEDQQPALQVQPNPLREELTVRASFAEATAAPFSLEIIDFSGKVVQQLYQGRIEFEFFEQQFYLNDLPEGIYMMVLRTDRGIRTQKIVKL